MLKSANMKILINYEYGQKDIKKINPQTTKKFYQLENNIVEIQQREQRILFLYIHMCSFFNLRNR